MREYAIGALVQEEDDTSKAKQRKGDKSTAITLGVGMGKKCQELRAAFVTSYTCLTYS